MGDDRGPRDSELYRLFFEHSLGLLCAHDLKGRLLRLSPASAQRLGYRPEELEGRMLRRMLAPELRGDFDEYLRRIAHHGHDRGILRVVLRGGDSQLWSYANRMAQVDGEEVVLGHAHDVTDLFRARGRLREMSEVDSTTRLPNRRSFVLLLSNALDQAQDSGEALTLALLNPVDFRAVNDRLGRSAGDRTLGEIGKRLAGIEDLHFAHYGGATFVGLLPWHGGQAGERMAQVRDDLSGTPFLDGALRLDFSVGLASFDPHSDHREDAESRLVRSASVALRQAASGDRSVILADGTDLQSEPLDRLTGIFTTDLATDYRNMMLMWDVLTILGAQRQPRAIAREVLHALGSAFALRHGSLLVGGADGEILWHEEEPVDEAVGADDEVRRALWSDLLAKAGSEIVVHDRPGGARVVVPLVNHARPQGLLLLECGPSSPFSGASDWKILHGLAQHVAAALDRAGMQERERLSRESESARLAREVEELRSLVQRSKLVYRSPAMERLVVTAGRIAATEATVLVTGQSGTGKEVMAQLIHQLSPRRGAEPVVVDLSSMTPTVIESELFGHVKGAFTGASEASPGRLRQADGSTVILDEIGELPLTSQSKLLRFVQEKQIIPVGGHQFSAVDVRIVACTNRNLGTEVEAGRFREDLYHRLNVLRLHLPPLTQRREDIEELARHFLARFDTQYGRRHQLSAEGVEALEAYSWPGNVRELQNCILRAVILDPGPVLGPKDFDLPSAEEVSTGRGEAASDPFGGVRRTWGEVSPDATPEPPPNSSAQDSLIEGLRRAVAEEIQAPPPRAVLGELLEEDLARAALAAADQVTSRAADLLDLPESTFRRREGRLSDDPTPVAPAWQAIRERLPAVVTEQGGVGGELFAWAQRSLLRAVVEALPDDPRSAAGLLGISPSTLRRRLQSLPAT